MNMLEPYSHLAVEWVNDLTGQRECRRCPRPITGIGDTLRHADEAIRPETIDPKDVTVVREFMHTVTQALSDMWTDRCSDEDRARVAVQALYRAGALNTKRRRRSRVPA